jgi:hypothetical protein
MGRDLGYAPLGRLSWAPEDSAASVDRVASYVAAEAERAISWYLDRKTSKRLIARGLRLIAILATACAGLIPLLAQILTSGGRPAIEPAWASVALIAAALAIALDQFLGTSKAWMRFLLTEMQLQASLHAFELSWEAKKARLQGKAPQATDIEEMLGLCRDFMHAVDAAVRDETTLWSTELSTALKDLEQAARVQADSQRAAAVTVFVTNGTDATDGWQLSIDGGAREVHRGTTAALRDLLPGSHVVSVTGIVQGTERSGERAFSCEAGGTVTVELKLE